MGWSAGASGFDRGLFYGVGVLPWSDGESGALTGEIAGFSRTNLTTPATMTIMELRPTNWSSRLISTRVCILLFTGTCRELPFFVVSHTRLRTYTTTKKKNKKQIDRLIRR